MYAVVYLVDAKQHIVVPKKYIFGLSQELLDNYGKRRNQKFLIFVSKRISENGLEPFPNINCIPNFGLNLSQQYPPYQDEACYIGQIKYFFASFQSAKIYAEKFRPLKPVTYNSALKEPVLPSLASITTIMHENSTNSLDDQNENNSLQDVSEPTEGIMFNDTDEANHTIDSLTIENNDNSLDEGNRLEATETIIFNESGHGNTEKSVSESQIANAVSNDLKDPLQDVDLQPDEIAAFSDIFNERDESSVNNHQERQDCRVNESPGGTRTITQLFDDECEMTFTTNEDFNPAPSGFQIKINDELSGNIPFKENLKKDRAYMLTIDGGIREITIAAKYVQGLISMNQAESRKNQMKDKIFVKALLISVCTLRLIQSLQDDMKIPKGMFNFIKDLFVIRIGNEDDEEGTRYRRFNNILRDACAELKQYNFK